MEVHGKWRHDKWRCTVNGGTINGGLIVRQDLQLIELCLGPRPQLQIS